MRPSYCRVACIGGERPLAERILEIADAALYRSKNADHNRVTATMLNATGE